MMAASAITNQGTTASIFRRSAKMFSLNSFSAYPKNVLSSLAAARPCPLKKFPCGVNAKLFVVFPSSRWAARTARTASADRGLPPAPKRGGGVTEQGRRLSSL